MTRQITILMCSLGMASCAPAYVYRPAENATATIKGHVAADYQIPPNAPEGDVRLASFGMSRISPSGTPNQAEQAVHLRMIVTDNDRAPWTLDTRQQVIALSDGQQLAPAYVTTREGQAGLPSVTVPANGKRIIDLFYPLPANMQQASQVPEFDVVWHIRTPQQEVTERTPFDRVRVEPADAYGYGYGWGPWGDGWGGPFWSDPLYAGYRGDIFVGAPHWGGWGGERGGFEGHGGGGEHGRR
jgi:hypothetical protein